MTEPMYCANHPSVETYLRCNRCGKPICPKCAVLTDVGYRCRECIRTQQKVFYTGFRPVYYAVAAAVSLPLAVVAGWLLSSLGWFAIVLGPLAGAGIAELARRAMGRRRGPYTWLVVCGCIVAGWLISLLLSLIPVLSIIALVPDAGGYLSSWLVSRGWSLVYLVTAAGAAYGRLRLGRRV
jgi:hypothetical protein